MKIPKIFVPERDLEKKVEQLLQGEQAGMINPTGIVIDEDIFEFKDKIFNDLIRIIQDNVSDQNDQEKYFKQLKTAKALYREEIKKMFNMDVNYQKIN